jgi:hypothetical protein
MMIAAVAFVAGFLWGQSQASNGNSGLSSLI